MNKILHKCTTSENRASIFLEYCSEQLRSGMYEHIPGLSKMQLGGFLFVCLFAYSRHWIWYHIYLGWSRHCLFQILGPTSLHHYGWRDGLHQCDLPSWGLYDKCALRRWVPQLNMPKVEALGETNGPVPSAVVPAWPASLSVWILALYFK